MALIAEKIEAESIIEMKSGPEVGFGAQTDLSAGSGETPAFNDVGMFMGMFDNQTGQSDMFEIMGSGTTMPVVGMKIKLYVNALDHNMGYVIVTITDTLWSSPSQWAVQFDSMELSTSPPPAPFLEDFSYQGNNTGIYILTVASTITIDADLTGTISVGDIVSVGMKRAAVTAIDGTSITIDIDISGSPAGTKVYKQELLPLISKAEIGNPSVINKFIKYDPVTNTIPAIDEVLQIDPNWLKQSTTYEVVYSLGLGQSYYVSSGGNTRYFNHQTLVVGDIVTFEGSTVPSFAYMVASSNSHEIATWYTESAPNGTTPNGEIQQHCANAGGTQSTQYKQMQSGGTWFPEYYNMKIYRKKALYA